MHHVSVRHSGSTIRFRVPQDCIADRICCDLSSLGPCLQLCIHAAHQHTIPVSLGQKSAVRLFIIPDPCNRLEPVMLLVQSSYCRQACNTLMCATACCASTVSAGRDCVAEEKTVALSQGRGIKLVQSVSGLQQALKDLEGVDIIASKYLHKPLLVNGFKFDLRVYVLVLACDPLRIFIYKEGLVRFCTEKYKAPQVS